MIYPADVSDVIRKRFDDSKVFVVDILLFPRMRRHSLAEERKIRRTSPMTTESMDSAIAWCACVKKSTCPCGEVSNSALECFRNTGKTVEVKLQSAGDASLPERYGAYFCL